MTAKLPIRKAFTLIELLVVIAIIAILLSLLTPLLSKAKEITRNVKCMANLKSVGTACHGFAAAHEGRFPGKGHDRICPHWSAPMHEILNREWWHNNDSRVYPTGDWQDPASEYGPLIRWFDFYAMDVGLIEKRIVCPSIRQWGALNRWHRPYRYNIHAEGGYDWGTYEFVGEFGKEIPDPWRVHTNYDRYAYGARTDIFKNASYQFLWCESEYANDDIFSTATGSGTVNLGGWGPDAGPPWSGGSRNGRHFSFRHMLPSSISHTVSSLQAMQQRARADFVFIDGHVENMGPNDRIDLKDRFWPN